MQPGRLYWAREFSGQPTYDTAAFDKRVDAIWRLGAGHGAPWPVAGRSGVWVFPAAHEQSGGDAQHAPEADGARPRA